MPPIRRYLRVTRYTVLEVRIHLDDPAQLSWLIKSSDPALPRLIAAIRPLVLPKLREEAERGKGKTPAKKRNVKDTIRKDDFEVSVFLTDSSTRHQLLTKTKEFAPSKERGTLRGWANGKSALVDDAEADKDVVVIREESPDDDNGLANIPLAAAPAKEGDDSDAEEGDLVPKSNARPGADDKKMAPRTTYDGFAIYGRVLCLVVKRRGNAQARGTIAAAKTASGDQMMESWVSTQAAQGEQDGSAEAG